jgi:hypothetical protein
MDKKYDLLQQLIDIFKEDQQRLEQSINKSVGESVTDAEILILAKKTISDIAITKRSINMLEDIKSMYKT